MIELIEQGKPVFGLYMPRDRSGTRTPMMLAREAISNRKIDFLFSGNMPNRFPLFLDGLKAQGVVKRGQLTHPMMLKIHKISNDPKGALNEISEHLNLAVNLSTTEFNIYINRSYSC